MSPASLPLRVAVDGRVLVMKPTGIGRYTRSLLRAMATQSGSVDRALERLLSARGDGQIRNRDFQRLEKVYIASLNDYLLRNGDVDSADLRRAILRQETFKL